MSRSHSDDSLSQVLALMSGHAVFRSLAVVTDLGIPDLLAGGARPATDLAAECQVDEEFLYRLLRVLAALGIFVEHPGLRFSLTPLSDRLRKDHPRSLLDFVRIRSHPMYWQAWGALDRAIHTGEAAFKCAHGADHFAYLDAHPEAARLFHDGMRSLSGQIYDAVIATCDFSRFRTVLDVGGGQGVLLAGILRACPGVRGILFDIASAIEQSGAVLQSAGVAERCRAIAGDFFAGIPQGADVAVLSRIVHNWGDSDAVRILENCRAALPRDGRLVIVEYVVTDDANGLAAKLFDLQMLVYFGRARERTEQEYRALLARAGFTLAHIKHTPAEIAVIEAVVS